MGVVHEDAISTKELLFSNSIKGFNAAGPAILNEAATGSNPTLIPDKTDEDTGIGRSSADALSLTSGGQEAARFTELSGNIIQNFSINPGLAADVTSAQGSGIIISSFNIYDTVGTAGDSATLPSTFAEGTIIFIKNGAAANSMDVFPASGDDLGQGVNTVEALAAGDFAVYIATTASSVWEKLMGGTA